MRRSSKCDGRGGLRLPAAAALLTVLMGACSGGSDEVVCVSEAIELEDGLEVQDSECGHAEPAGKGDILSVSYQGSVQGEGVFETSDEPFRFRLGVGEVIDGWDEGVRGMQEGGVRTLTIPPDLGYGSIGLEPDIPPGATLVYEIELISLRPADESRS